MYYRVGGFGNAVLFDTSSNLPSNINSTASAMIRQFRTVNTIYAGDVYWHIGTGRVYRATVDRINTTTNSTFTELTNNQGFVDMSGLLNTGTAPNERIEFTSTSIDIFDNSNQLRVKIGKIS